MILVNEKLPSTKFALGKDVVSTDEKGQIEVSDAAVIESLLASGFVEVGAKKKFKGSKQEAPVAPEAPVEPAQEAAPEEAPEEAQEEAEENLAPWDDRKKNKKNKR